MHAPLVASQQGTGCAVQGTVLRDLQSAQSTFRYRRMSDLEFHVGRQRNVEHCVIGAITQSREYVAAR